MMEKKERRITIYKNQVFYDIDNRTFKFADASLQERDTKERNAISSDNDNSNDHDLLHRLVDNRDATIRKRLTFCLKDEEILEIDNKPDESDTYVYDLVLPLEFKDVTLKVVVTKIHEYLVRGGLMDWYIETGIADTKTSIGVMDSIVSDLEDDIVGNLRMPSSVKKPLQPFGPRY